jgi:hypothetical protein
VLFDDTTITTSFGIDSHRLSRVMSDEEHACVATSSTQKKRSLRRSPDPA